MIVTYQQMGEPVVREERNISKGHRGQSYYIRSATSDRGEGLYHLGQTSSLFGSSAMRLNTSLDIIVLNSLSRHS